MTPTHLKSPGFLSIIFKSELKFGYKGKSKIPVEDSLWELLVRTPLPEWVWETVVKNLIDS